MITLNPQFSTGARRAGFALAATLLFSFTAGCGPTKVDEASVHLKVVPPLPADYPDQLAANAGIKLVRLPAGSFTMGSPDGEAGRQADEGPPTRVTLTHDFYLGATAVTQGQYRAVTGSNPSEFKGDSFPVDSVSWEDAMAFCKKLTDRERAAGRLPPGWLFSLPTEAQWEYASRAGSTGANPDGLAAMVWHDQDNGKIAHPVGRNQPNAWGLYDLHGDIMEWCYDWYGPYPGGEVTDPAGPTNGERAVLRGGGLWAGPNCRSAFRDNHSTGFQDNYLGFRLALLPDR